VAFLVRPIERPDDGTNKPMPVRRTLAFSDVRKSGLGGCFGIDAAPEEREWTPNFCYAVSPAMHFDQCGNQCGSLDFSTNVRHKTSVKPAFSRV
jgi:hypothetical protein